MRQDTVQKEEEDRLMGDAKMGCRLKMNFGFRALLSKTFPRLSML